MSATPFVLVGQNELATTDQPQTMIPAELLGSTSKYATDDTFDNVSSQGFLPRLQLFGGGSDAVKEGKIPIAHYGLVISKDEIVDLGDRIDMLPIAWRPKAVRLGDGSVTSVFNPEHPEFKKIKEESEEPDSKSMYGVEYLVWLFSQKKLATLLMGSKTARKEARNIRPLIGRPATLRVALVSNASYKWHAIKAIGCSTVYEAPDFAKLKDEINRFNSPEEKSDDFSPAELEAQNAAAKEEQRPR